MLATNSRTIMFLNQRRTVIRNLSKCISQPMRTLSKELKFSSSVRHELGLSQNKVCSWCRHNHTNSVKKLLGIHVYTNTVNNNLLENCTKNRNALCKTSLRKLQLSIELLNVQRRGLATVSRVDLSQKVPLAKSAPLRRVGRKKQLTGVLDDSLHHMNVVSYAVGEELNLNALRNEFMTQGVYDIVDLPRDITDVLVVTANYKVDGQSREGFFFSDGGVAFWHMSESERHDLWKLARTFAINPYDHHLIVEESENLSVVYDNVTKLKGSTVQLKTPAQDKHFDEESTLHKYTFSNALSQSVNLAMSEANLERFIDQLEPETQKLRRGVKSSLKKRDINMRLGEVFQLRHEINLESGFLDHPDIYWDRDELEGLYREIIVYLSIPKRIKVLNERLNYCSEILQLLSSQQNDQHHIRLEWIIIILILIEVVFECMHYAEKYGIVLIENPEKKNLLKQTGNTSEQNSNQQKTSNTSAQQKAK